ncbi:MAG TPA: SpoIID/LytB domain-containing protein [Candidatus Limnocylindria bacterium]|nr:SpoIID/LytB domain-containing protein [Candidatus Limnocylindria bacterium]
MRLVCAAAIVIASVLVATNAAAASRLAAMPATVRVNVTGLGLAYAVISSTGTISAIAPDGTLLYRGEGKTLARTNVRTVAALGIELPPRESAGALSREARADRTSLIREARQAIADGGPRALVTTPFQLSLLQSADDDLGKTILRSDRIPGITFRASNGLLTVNGQAYRGTFELAPDDEGDMIVVNIVSPHDYLASVVGSEEPSSWEGEALAAQAIAARTYLYTHLGKHTSYDLEGDTRDQEYDGTVNEDARTLRAVERTAGLVVTYDGAPIEALYSANAGGITEDSETVFANALPYLRSVPSPGDRVALDSAWGRTSYEWTKEISATQLGDFMRQRGLSVGTPTSIRLTRVSPTGRVITASVTGTAGTQAIGKDRSRYYFGLRSSLFTVTVLPTGASERVDAANADRIAALELLGAHVTQASFDVVRDGNGNELGLRVTAYRYELPATFVFSGRGFGHGVGLSQWGAQGMALDGATYQQILAHYYVGTALTAVGGD